jgi:tetratricopeptide (TPR) repeat protein
MKYSSAIRIFLITLLLASFFPGCSRDPNVRKQKYLESGQRYFDKGKYREAAIQFSNAIQVDSQFVAAHYQLAQSYLKMQNWSMAFQELDRTVQIQPDHIAAHLDMANMLIAGSQFKQAQEHIDAILAKDPDNAQAHMAEANLKAGQQDLNAALQEMQTAIRLDPNRWESYLNLALLQLKTDSPDAAEANFKHAIALNPQATNAQLALGAFYQQRSRFADAEQTFRHAMQIAPTSPDPRAALTRLYMAQGRKADAEQLLRQTKTDLADVSAGYRMLGDFYYATGDLDKAVDEYASLYKEHSKDVQVKKNYIQLLILKSRLDEASRLNDEVLKANPGDNDGLIYRGQLQIRQGHPNEAADTLQQALHNDSENGIAHYHLGVAFDQMGNLSRAESEWRLAVRFRPDLIEAQKALAAAELRKSSWDALATTAGQIINLQPSLPDGYVLRAVSEINRKRIQSAEEDIRKAMEVAPQNPVGYIHMGNLRFQQKNLGEAEKYYEQALQRDPNAADALGGLSNIYVVQKQPDKAIARVQAQIGKQPNNANYHSLLGALLFNNKDLEGAEAELRKAVDLDKNNADAVLKLGQVQAAAGQPDQAAATYEAFLHNNPRDIRFYILSGQLYEQKRDWAKAKDSYQKALQLQSDNPLASNNLAYVLLEQGGDVDTAMSMAQIARRGMPDSPNAADTLGWAYYHKGAYKSAIDLFKEALKLNKDHPEVATFHYHLGLAYQKTDQNGLARQQFERALKIDPSFSNADDARKLLAALR